MYEQIAIQQILNEKLSEARVRNPAFSLRAFAQKIGCSSAAVSEILNGKRRVSKKMATRLLTRLNVDAERFIKILDLFKDREPTPSPSGLSRQDVQATYENAKRAIRLKAYEFDMIANWYHFAILSLAETQDFDSSPFWIANRLGISVNEVKKALERLEALGAIEIQDGQLKLKGIHYRTTDGEKSLALRHFHSQQLELARRSIECDPQEMRDFTSTTMAIDVKNLSKARELVRSFRSQISALLEAGEAQEVYVFSCNLFPVSRREK